MDLKRLSTPAAIVLAITMAATTAFAQSGNEGRRRSRDNGARTAVSGDQGRDSRGSGSRGDVAVRRSEPRTDTSRGSRQSAPPSNTRSDNAGQSTNRGNASRGGAAPSDNAGQYTNRGNASRGNAAPSDNAGQNANRGNASRGSTAPSDNAGQYAARGNASRGSAAPRDNAGQYANRGNASRGSTAPSDNAGQYAARGNASRGSAAPSYNAGQYANRGNTDRGNGASGYGAGQYANRGNTDRGNGASGYGAGQYDSRRDNNQRYDNRGGNTLRGLGRIVDTLRYGNRGYGRYGSYDRNAWNGRVRFGLGISIFSGRPFAFRFDYGWRPGFSYYYSMRQGMVYGGMSFLLDPDYAEVYIDGEFVGIAGDFGGQPVPIAVGFHRIELYAQGFEPVAFDINVLPGQVIPYRGSLYPVY